MRRLVVVSALLALLAAACGRGGGDGPEFALRALEGGVERHDGRGWQAVSEQTAVSFGDQIRTGSDGWALVTLTADHSIELAPQTTIRLRERSTAELLSGRVLVTAPRSLGIGLEDIEVRGTGGLFRVDRGFQYQVRVYEGAATIPGSAWDGEVPALREVVVVGGSVPRAPRPVSVDPGDRWDERIFASWIDVGLSLDRLEEGLERQLPGQKQRSLIARATPRPIPAEMVETQLRSRPISQWADVVLAAVVAARTEADGDPPALMQGVLSMRDLGGSWIVVAAEYRITEAILAAISQFSGALADLIAGAVADATGQGGGGPGGGAGSGGASGGGSGGGSGSSGGSSGSSGGSSGGSDGDGSGGGGGSGDDGGGGGPGPSPSPSPSGCAPGDVLCELVDDTLGGAPSLP